MADFKEIINQSKPTLVDFFATWCEPCKMQMPVLQEVKSEIGDAANIIKIDIDANPAAAAEYRVQSVPTLIIFVDGKPVWRDSGLQPKHVLVDRLREHIKAD